MSELVRHCVLARVHTALAIDGFVDCALSQIQACSGLTSFLQDEKRLLFCKGKRLMRCFGLL